MTENSPAEHIEIPPNIQPPQSMKAVIVPLDLFNRMHDLIRDAAHRHADPVLKEMAALQIHDVNIGPRKANE